MHTMPLAEVSRLPGARWLLRAGGSLIVCDAALTERAVFPIPGEAIGRHWVAPSLQFAVISATERVAALDLRGRIIWATDHPAWGRGASASGSVLVTSDERLVWATVPSEDGPDEWWVLDATTGETLGCAELECFAVGSQHLQHPDQVHVGLAVGEGQDACEVYWGAWVNGAIDGSRLESRERVLIDVQPDGARYLTTPHDGRQLHVHAFPSGDVIARRCGREVLQDDDDFDFVAGYVNNDTVIVSGVERREHLLLRAVDLSLLGRVEYPEDEPLGTAFAGGDGTWLKLDRRTGACTLWRLPAFTSGAASQV